MELEKEQIANKPIMPIWVSIPLFIIASRILMLVTSVVYVSFEQLIKTDSVYVSLFKEIIQWSILAAVTTFTAYIFLKYIDLVSPKELGLSIKGRAKDCLGGFLLAIVLYAIGFSVSLMLGAVSVTEVHFDFLLLTLNLLLFFVAAWFEEVLCRGYIQGRLMTKMNKFLALGITSIIFSALHLGNQHIDVLPMINLFLAGIMLGASFLYTRNLWFPIVLHMFWNWIQGPVLGYEVSGTERLSLLTLSLPENNIINGGAFGFEGSIICTVLLILASGLIILWGEKK
ncbi:CPBP family intramembrane glutamic endopeptidase [Bacteroides sp. 519]|uniref:CPBP family intramembrane glutamic endopeptidase n=1 Tax=Bacteroides sp. 519 TaxID=2302937 RepID=UPI0013D1AD81|nr:type II CAAX endopeptidase family protein [Bacteroides sp. 519]NDV59709.1 CPBP family intramembrane metalloprotease [Bacteroides sp. 519]